MVKGKRRNGWERAFDIANVLFLGTIGLLALFPFAYVLSLSLSSAADVQRGSLNLVPSHPSFDAYRILFKNPDLATGLLNSIVRTALGTAMTLLATCVAAYPLAQKTLPHRSLYIRLILFTMLFSGGIVPTFLLVRGLGMIDTVWALVVPGMLTGFNVLLVKNFFEALPVSLSESASVEGAGPWTVLFRIYIPLSAPVLATVGLWMAVAHWNGWFDALLYINDDRKQPLQTFLQRVVIENSSMLTDIGGGSVAPGGFTPETVKAATVVITILPMILIYPFVQRFFTKGILLGGVKE
ncbi:carbohydrate ABC transporter permease [bacterium]|nr:MAG: carbohydrate ABC transporter permease [bacterium]